MLPEILNLYSHMFQPFQTVTQRLPLTTNLDLNSDYLTIITVYVSSAHHSTLPNGNVGGGAYQDL